MSALGQKQTCAVQNGMSALPPKADIERPLILALEVTGGQLQCNAPRLSTCIHGHGLTEPDIGVLHHFAPQRHLLLHETAEFFRRGDARVDVELAEAVLHERRA